MPNLKLKVLNGAGDTLAVSQEGERASLVYTAAYAPGDWIALETDAPGAYCALQLEDSMPEALVYIKGCAMNFPIPPANDRNNYSPKSFTGSTHLIRARIAAEEETAARRNLALNPYDTPGEHGFYPHATANVETSACFAPRNAIDGIYENAAHGSWPYQSWGINRDPRACLRVDFGRPVCLDQLRLTLRADFPHDSCWTSATAAFSDGSCEVLQLRKTAASQCFAMKPRRVEWLELKNLIKAEDRSPFPALTQLEAWGTEAGTNENL